MTSDNHIRADWIAVDWGTSNLRAWAMATDGSVLAEATSDQGMSTLTAADYEPALLGLIADWLGTDVTDVQISGMAGSRQGWIESPYSSVPCPPVSGPGVLAPTADPRLNVRIVPGLSQSTPADVMRGEETQIAGFLSSNPGFDGVLCLPGTHSKWVEISAAEVISFRTFMTGELFALLAKQSVLRHSLGMGWDEAAFEAAVAEAQTHPEAMARTLFGLRAESLLAGLSPSEATARLSGTLIGAELAAARPYWLGRPVALIGASKLVDVYAAALGLQGLMPKRCDAGQMTRLGLATARNSAIDPAPTLH